MRSQASGCRDKSAEGSVGRGDRGREKRVGKEGEGRSRKKGIRRYGERAEG